MRLSRVSTKNMNVSIENQGASRVPLENISIMLKEFEDFVHVMRGIRPLQLPDSTAREMLNAFLGKR